MTMVKERLFSSRQLKTFAALCEVSWKVCWLHESQFGFWSPSATEKILDVPESKTASKNDWSHLPSCSPTRSIERLGTLLVTTLTQHLPPPLRKHPLGEDARSDTNLSGLIRGYWCWTVGTSYDHWLLYHCSTCPLFPSLCLVYLR